VEFGAEAGMRAAEGGGFQKSEIEEKARARIGHAISVGSTAVHNPALPPPQISPERGKPLKAKRARWLGTHFYLYCVSAHPCGGELRLRPDG
jgi:hypothetical protein